MPLSKEQNCAHGDMQSLIRFEQVSKSIKHAVILFRLLVLSTLKEWFSPNFNIKQPLLG